MARFAEVNKPVGLTLIELCEIIGLVAMSQMNRRNIVYGRPGGHGGEGPCWQGKGHEQSCLSAEALTDLA